MSGDRAGVCICIYEADERGESVCVRVYCPCVVHCTEDEVAGWAGL